jgi:protein pelota
LAKASSIIDEIMILANKKSRKFTMGYEETFNANQMGAVESLVFSDKAIQENNEQQMMDFLNDVENKGVKIYSVDASTDIGLRVTGLGGIVSLLRYAIES